MRDLNPDLLNRLLSVPKSEIKGEGAQVRTKSLFADVIAEESNYKPVYYLKKEVSDANYIALKEIYLALEDPTEFYFATLCFYNYAQWEIICDLAWAKNIVSQWRKELALKLRAQAVDEIYKMTLDSSGTKETSKLAALKWLADSGYVNKLDKRKRSTKEEKDSPDNLINLDAERLGLKVVK